LLAASTAPFIFGLYGEELERFDFPFSTEFYYHLAIEILGIINYNLFLVDHTNKSNLSQ
jgi:hypothetical protein